MTCPHILVVEDDPALVLLLEDVLRDEGYQTTAWASGTDVVAAIGQAQPDLVILDLWLEERGDG